MNNKIKNLWIAVIMLLVLNLTTIGTILYHNYTEQNNTDNIWISPDIQPINGKYFRQQLNFDDRQMEVFRSANHKLRQHANDLIRNIDAQKELLFIELQSQEPNYENIKEISSQIGSLHAQLKVATAEFYITVNSVCNQQQKENMKDLFSPLFRETPNTGNGRGHGNRRGLHNQYK